ncbi:MULTISPECIES: glycosyltransferase family 4 protein [unclassified Paenibacillus]|uniref:glycosyltransferase family 4 protein n=1 Tax=unclassified Paenibacillus TaxID=185978 RepID=UPI0010516C29|nr:MULTISPECIES: glycosyltransferase family 4 protein [unclassified Paenibacillus]NIK70650.1 glycosyltransferase involved in cell wall biosynthesis [Paenibacillus sp. BK720]TCM86440.1 glycosyltransferase involved in cell wall biosynthesis [Paenibacillus sp. BK033]
MRIVQISTNTIPVPPKDYGGTQRDVHYLTEELVNRGHEVILFAKKGSTSNATQTFEYESDDPKKQLDFIIKNLPPDVDIIHDHYGIVAKANPPIPTICNSHSKGIKGDVQLRVYVSKFILRKYGKRKGYAVHNGIRMEDYTYTKDKQNYLLFMGRLIKEKGVHLAIKVAKKTGMRLIIAGTMNDKAYFNAKIKPHLGKKISYIGPVGGDRKRELLANASCVLFTSTWDEPFGLVLIESLASGTPVLGFKKGGVAEVLKGMPQLLCKTTSEMARKVKYRKKLLPRSSECRRYARSRYSDRIMTDGFLNLYQKIIDKKLYKIKKNTLWNRREAKLLAAPKGDDM